MIVRDYSSLASVSSFSSLSVSDVEEENRTNVNNFDSTKPPILPVGQSLKTLYLPPSIDSIDNLSSGLWNWIHTQDFISQESANDLTAFQGSGTKVIFNSEKMINGKIIKNKHAVMDNHENASLFEIVGKNVKTKNNSYKCPLPRPLPPKKKSNLDSLQTLRGSESSISKSIPNLSSESSSLLYNSVSSIATRVDESSTNSSVYIQVVELQGKLSSKLSSIYCVVEVGKRKYRSDPIKVEKNSTSIPIREGFLFDVPSANFTAVVKVYGIHQPHGKSVFSTLTRPFNRRISTIRRSNFTLNNSIEFNNQMSQENIWEGTEIYLGEISFQLTNIKFSKLTGTYPLLISSSSSISSVSSSSSKLFLKNRKNVHKVPKMVIQMGIYNEEQSNVDSPKIPSDIKNISLEYNNFISILINSNQKSIWRRYWAQILNNFIYIYDSEYKNKKEPISRLNLGFIKEIGRTDPEQIYVNNGITIEFRDEYLSNETGEELIQNAKTIPLQFEYINGDEILVEDLVNNKESWSKWNLSSMSEDCRLYAYVDSKSEVTEWIDFINKAREINQ
ncbi:hypothetical protein BCR32DRAFT_267133 [Anaeromyces robustus]|uniref:PH domain-containing protein n=1 Tax=Anaeromyces robustus TaxID=1754192 RepID=A0A1Y1XBR7_9FUNG|nr:hypothetical protein BCR32DRAFT_267133 [Anaeromyces robustus]|eukprot:ORX83162.1 hypothetical protein BCR32DRAFT_267133 [Anaeromyces robustus]